MDCQEIERQFEDLLEERLTDPERRAAQAHLAICERCRELFEIAQGNRALLVPEAQEDLTRAILERTSGLPCRRAEASLCDLVDGTLLDEDAELTSLHLEHCAGCQRLAETLTWMRRELPEMAELEPAAGFSAEVLRATARLHAPGSGLWAGLRERWQRWIIRPRFTWEAAYICTVLLGLIVSIPNSPVRQLPPKTLTVLQSNLGAALNPDAWAPEVRARLSLLGEQAWQRTGFKVVGEVERLTDRAVERYDRVQEPFTDLRRHGSALRSAVANKNFVYAAIYLGRMRDDLLQIWHQVWQ